MYQLLEKHMLGDLTSSLASQESKSSNSLLLLFKIAGLTTKLMVQDFILVSRCLCYTESSSLWPVAMSINRHPLNTCLWQAAFPSQESPRHRKLWISQPALQAFQLAACACQGSSIRLFHS